MVEREYSRKVAKRLPMLSDGHQFDDKRLSFDVAARRAGIVGKVVVIPPRCSAHVNCKATI
jgi:hypothetical protein